jgi:hypothetical protein
MAILYGTTQVDDTDPQGSSAVSDDTLQTHTNASASKVGKNSRPERLNGQGREEHDDSTT